MRTKLPFRTTFLARRCRWKVNTITNRMMDLWALCLLWTAICARLTPQDFPKTAGIVISLSRE